MLKIKDASGETIAILGDTDNAPQIVKEPENKNTNQKESEEDVVE